MHAIDRSEVHTDDEDVDDHIKKYSDDDRGDGGGDQDVDGGCKTDNDAEDDFYEYQL